MSIWGRCNEAQLVGEEERITKDGQLKHGRGNNYAKHGDGNVFLAPKRSTCIKVLRQDRAWHIVGTNNGMSYSSVEGNNRR